VLGKDPEDLGALGARERAYEALTELGAGGHELAARLLAELAVGGDGEAIEALAEVAAGRWARAIELLAARAQAPVLTAPAANARVSMSTRPPAGSARSGAATGKSSFVRSRPDRRR
jgi:hypothetical protein